MTCILAALVRVSACLTLRQGVQITDRRELDHELPPLRAGQPSEQRTDIGARGQDNKMPFGMCFRRRHLEGEDVLPAVVALQVEPINCLLTRAVIGVDPLHEVLDPRLLRHQLSRLPSGDDVICILNQFLELRGSRRLGLRFLVRLDLQFRRGTVATSDFSTADVFYAPGWHGRNRASCHAPRRKPTPTVSSSPSVRAAACSPTASAPRSDDTAC